MVELGQLERRHEAFAARRTRVIVVSVESRELAAQTQAQFPHLLVLCDEGLGLSGAIGVVHAKAAPDGSDAATPTTILVDPKGEVRWLFRPTAVITRLGPDEVLQAVDEHLPPR